MKIILIVLCCACALSGCSPPPVPPPPSQPLLVGIVGGEPAIWKTFSPKSRIGIIGVGFGQRKTDGINTIALLPLIMLAAAQPAYLPGLEVRTGSVPPSFHDQFDKDLYTLFLPAFDQEMSLQSKGVIEYVPLPQIQVNNNKSDQAFVQQVIKDNHLDALLQLILLEAYSLKVTTIVRIYDQNFQERALFRTWNEISPHGFPRVTPPSYKINEDGKMVRVPGLTLNLKFYFRVLAKASVSDLVRYFQSGPFEVRTRNGIRIEHHPPLISN